MTEIYDLIVVGGGAAGFFGALAAKEHAPEANVLLLEKTSQLLTKVRISGGGRCNVTHSCFEPRPLTANYPRGQKELIGPFHRFQPQDTVQWFHARGVELKTESDGRMFPITDSSETIIDCLMHEADQLNIEIRLKQSIEKIEKSGDLFSVILADGATLFSKTVLLATGSSPHGHTLAKHLGHSIQELAPSLFTFNIPNSPLQGLEGIAVKQATLRIAETSFEQTGPLLITHWGFSGPAALKLSAWAARFLKEQKYAVKLQVNWVGVNHNNALDSLKNLRRTAPSQTINNSNLYNLPKNLWKRLVELSGIVDHTRLSDISNEVLNTLANKLTTDVYQVNGKTTYKEEFVTCGGVTLTEVDFKTMESRLCPGLFFAGEVLDIDAVTGGFNFQNAWTTSWIAGQAAVGK